MKALILAAGLGTRLKPFTEQHPKPLYKVDGITLLEHALNHVRSAGINEVIVNVHHFADQIIEYLHVNNNFGLKISISDETGELLETGGGLKKCAWFFTGCDSVLIRNVDILSDLDLTRMYRFHLESKTLATLAVRNRETTRYFLFDEHMNLVGWENFKTGERRMSQQVKYVKALAFSGIQIVDPEIFPLITEQGKFSLTSLYLRLAQSTKISGYLEDGKVWKDVGTMQKSE